MAHQDLSLAADRHGPPWGNRTTYLLWYGPVTAINPLLLERASARTLLSAEAALLNLLLTAVLRSGRLAGALNRAAVRLAMAVLQCAEDLPRPPSG